MADSDFSDVEHWKGLSADFFSGTAEALIEAGIVRADQLLGAPGRNKTCVTFNAVSRVSEATEHYLKITRRGARRYNVTWGLPVEERARREAEIRAGSAEPRATQGQRHGEGSDAWSTPQHAEGVLAALYGVLTHLADHRHPEDRFEWSARDRNRIYAVVADLGHLSRSATLIARAPTNAVEGFAARPLLRLVKSDL